MIFAAVAALMLPSVANAQVAPAGENPTPPRDDVSSYPLEIEPHFAFGADNVYGSAGFGAGLRMSIPLVAGAMGSVPDNVAISFGADLLHYDNCFFGGDCGANYLMLPVAAQWNVFVVRRASVFAEGGVFLYKGWFNGCRPLDGPGCSAPSDFGLLPTLAIGGRIHLTPAVAMTLRLGYPTVTLGVSLM
jgi:hypothetical protein